MPYADKNKPREVARQWRERIKAENPCNCGNSKGVKSHSCRKCYDEERKPRTARGKQYTRDSFTVCPSCQGRMASHRTQCVACIRGIQSGTKRAGNGKGVTIKAYLACPPTSDIKGDTLVFCWYYKHKMLNILAPSVGMARKYVKEFYRGLGTELVGSVCRIAGVDVNLTGIDLLEYQQPNNRE